MGNFLKILIACLLTALIISGCSGDPVKPDVDARADNPSVQREASTNFRTNLGYYDLIIYPDSLEAEIVPLRSAELHLNAAQFMNNTMGVSIATVPGQSDPLNGLIVLDITLTHPLGIEQFTGFDVMGIMMVPGSLSIGSLIFPDADETHLLNADGYTRWWNPSEFTTPGLFGYTQGNLTKTQPSQLTATVNPYKYFANILYPESTMTVVYAEPMENDSGRGVFSAGEDNTRRYEIQFEMSPGPVIRYGYAIGASWAPPTVKPPGEVPDDFPIEANQPEPFYIGTAVRANSLYYDTESGTGGGVLRLQANIHDWQGQQAGTIADEVALVRIYSPDLFSGGVDAPFKEESAIRAVYTADLTDTVNPTHPGDSMVIIRAESQDGPTYDQGFGQAPDDQISAFQAITVNVLDPDCDPDANNEFVDYIEFDLDSPLVDQLCGPTDYKDFFRFEFDPGTELSGDLVLNCDVEPTRFELYDLNEVKITEENVSGGTAVMNLDALDLLPGQYYIRIVTQSSDIPFLYLLELDGEIVDLIIDPVNVTPEFSYFETKWVESDDTYAYFTGPWAFWIFDTSMSTDSLPYSRTNIITTHRPAFSYPYACFPQNGWNANKISIMDMSDPANPIVYDDVYPTTDLIHAVTMDDNYIYLIVNDTVNEKLIVLDYSSSPSSPTVVSDTYTFSSQINSLDIMHTSEPADYLIALKEKEMTAVDITDPTNPATNVANFGYINGEIRDLVIKDNLIYLIYSNTSDDEYMQIVEVSSGSTLWKGTAALTQDCHYLDVRGNYTYLTDDDHSLTVVDSTNSNSPFQDNAGSTSYISGDIDVNGNRIFIVNPLCGLGLYAGDESSSWLGIHGHIIGINDPSIGFIDGDYMYATQFYSSYNKSLITIDISDPENFFLADYLEFDEQPNMVTQISDGIVVGTCSDDFWTVNNYDPNNLVKHEKETAPASITGITGYGAYLYVADYTPQLNVYNFPLWLDPDLQNSIPTATTVGNLKIYNGNLYCTRNESLYIYSLTDPANPTLVNTYFASGNIGDYEVQGDYMYIMTWGTLEVLDYTDPLNPTFISSSPLSSPWLVTQLTIEGQFAYTGHNGGGAYNHLIWPPDNPGEIGQFLVHDFPDVVWDMIFLGDYMFVTNFAYGPEIYKMHP